MAFAGMRELAGRAAFLLLLLVTALVVYFDDIQIRGPRTSEVATIYNVRLAGVKIIDLLSACLLAAAAGYATLRGSLRITPVHRNLLLIAAVYCWAALIGFLYGFAYRYDAAIWIQDGQQVVYMIGYFLAVYHLLDTRGKWRAYVASFLIFLALKNYLILFQTLTGVGKAIGDWAFRASQNAEFTYFPMLFFPLILLLLRGRSRAARLLFAATVFVYLFNSLLGIYRTVWVMLLVGSAWLLFHLSGRERWRILAAGTVVIAGVVVVISLMFPRFVDLAFGFKFLSIFEWSLAGDRSNATRILEVINVTHRIFSEFAFLQGMGLGAWWDDSARRLLQDYGSGFTFKWRFHGTHMWYVTQLLKLGIIGTALYWFAFYRIFRHNLRGWRRAALRTWEGHVVLGLLAGLLCAVVSSADFVRMFLVIGINLGILTAFSTLWGGGSDVVPSTPARTPVSDGRSRPGEEDLR